MARQGLSVLRGQTKAFIDENPRDITITRYVTIPDNAGGTLTTESTLAPQTVRLIEQRTTAPVERRNVSGEIVRPEFALLAEYDADIQPGDTFDVEGRTFEVVYVGLEQTYSLNAEVKRI